MNKISRIIVAVVFINFVSAYFVYAEFVVGLNKVKTFADIAAASEAGFDSVYVSKEVKDVKKLKEISHEAQIYSIKIISDTSDLTKINLVDDKGKILKKEDLRFCAYNEIINNAKGLIFDKYYYDEKPLFENKKGWENITDAIQEISFTAEIINKGNRIENPEEITKPLEAVSYEYGGIKYTFVVNPTEKRQTLPVLFFQPNFDVVGEKSSNLRKLLRKAKNNFKPYKVFVFRYE